MAVGEEVDGEEAEQTERRTGRVSWRNFSFAYQSEKSWSFHYTFVFIFRKEEILVYNSENNENLETKHQA